MRGRGLRWPSLAGRVAELAPSERAVAKQRLIATLSVDPLPINQPKKKRQTRLGRGSAIPNVNKGEELFAFQVSAVQLPPPNRNYVFHATRKWQIDFAWPAVKIGVEIQGGIYMAGGAHALPTHIERDLRKHNALLDAGWQVWHWMPQDITSGEALQHIEPVLRCALNRLLPPKT